MQAQEIEQGKASRIPDKFMLSAPEVAVLIGVSMVTLWRLRKRPDFPKGFKISKRCNRWRKTEIEGWLANCERIA